MKLSVSYSTLPIYLFFDQSYLLLSPFLSISSSLSFALPISEFWCWIFAILPAEKRKTLKSESSIFYLLCFFSSSSSSTYIPPLFLSPFISIYFSLSFSIRRTPHWRISMLNIRNIIRKKMKNSEIATFPKHQKSKKTNHFYVTHFLPLLLSSFASISFSLYFSIFLIPHRRNLMQNIRNIICRIIIIIITINQNLPFFFISFIIYLTHIPSLILFSFISISPLFYSILPTIHWRTLMLNFRNIIRRRMKNKEIRTFLFYRVISYP